MLAAAGEVRPFSLKVLPYGTESQSLRKKAPAVSDRGLVIRARQIVGETTRHAVR